MPLAVTHVIITIIIVDLYRDYVTKHKKYFTLHTVFIAGLGGLLPDIDFPISHILNYFGYSAGLLYHGGITHTFFFGLIFPHTSADIPSQGQAQDEHVLLRDKLRDNAARDS